MATAVLQSLGLGPPNPAAYSDASAVQVTIDVGKKQQTISVAQTVSKTFGDSSFNLGATSTGTGSFGYTLTSGAGVVSLDGSGNVTILSGGSAIITVSQLGVAHLRRKKSSYTVTRLVASVFPSPSG
jgi:hypothetical protein